MKNKKQYISLILILFFCTLGGYLLGTWLGKNDIATEFLMASKEDLWIIIPGIILMMILILVIHEAGHLIMGLLMGFKFQLFVVTFLGIRKDEEGPIKIYFNKDLNMFGGAASTVPTEDDSGNARKFALTVIAGPLFSLLFAGVFLLFALYSIQPFKVILISGAFFSLIIFLATTLPSKTGIFYTDRKRFQRLISKGKSRQVELALLKAIGLQMSGKSITNLEMSEIEAMKSDDSPILKYTGFYYEHQYWKIKDPIKLPQIRAEMEILAQELPQSVVRGYEREMGLRSGLGFRRFRERKGDGMMG
jgi:hypothetical protein